MKKDTKPRLLGALTKDTKIFASCNLAGYSRDFQRAVKFYKTYPRSLDGDAIIACIKALGGGSQNSETAVKAAHYCDSSDVNLRIDCAGTTGTTLCVIVDGERRWVSVRELGKSLERPQYND